LRTVRLLLTCLLLTCLLLTCLLLTRLLLTRLLLTRLLLTRLLLARLLLARLRLLLRLRVHLGQRMLLPERVRNQRHRCPGGRLAHSWLARARCRGMGKVW
jgi:hypothetical protein